MQPPRQIYVPPGGPPQGPGPSREIYGLMGEANIFRMLEDFYLELANSDIRHIFPNNTPEEMKEASKRSAAFFVSVLGGPPMFHQLYGDPMMRRRHMGFEIDEAARQVWLGLFYRVLEGAEQKYSFPAQHLPGFKQFLDEFSGWMVNKA